MVICMDNVPSKLIADALDRIETYQRLLAILEKKADDDGLCRVPSKVLGNFLELSHTETLRALDKLEAAGTIEKVELSSYRLRPEASEEWRLTEALLRLLAGEPGLTFEEQASRLRVDYAGLETAYARFVGLVT